MPRMTADEIDAFLADHFPQAQGHARIETIGDDTMQLRLPYRDAFLRPGGTLSGPTLMTLADTSMYFLILAMIGPVALAVTTDLNIHFLRRPSPRDLIAHVRMLKLGKRLAVGEVLITSDGEPGAVAHATATYALPPR